MKTLYSSEKGKNYLVTQIPDISLLENLGIFVGSQILKKRTYKLGGPVLVEIDTREVAIGKEIAKLIKVQ